MPPFFLPSELSKAVEKLVFQMQAHSPFLGPALHTWICRMSPTGEPAAELAHPQMFPVLPLPKWMVESLEVNPDLEFHEAITYSSICGYYYTRLMDDLLDGHVSGPDEIHLLPATAFLVSEFQFSYQKYFPPQHEFWEQFRGIWMDAADRTSEDATLRTVSPEDFERVSSRKFAAVGIPVVATAYFYGHPEAVSGWLQFVHTLAKWSQMFDDLLDWHADRKRGNATWFLSEADRRKCSSESVDQWVVREGLAWAFGLMQQWMDDLQRQAQALGSPSAQDFLQQRESLRQEKGQKLERGFASLKELAAILGKS